MIVGIGLDIVDTQRLARTLAGAGAAAFERRVFTPGELAACAGRVDRVEALAARFAAKEACLKALGVGLFEAGLQEVEVVRGRGGVPRIRLSGEARRSAGRARVRHVHISLTHEPGFAAAVVILEGTKARVPSPQRW